MKQADLFRKGISAEEMLAIKQGMDDAHKDSTPFPIISKDGMTVVGDPNKTEIKKHDYTIMFRFPKSMADGMNIDKKDIVKETNDNVYVNVDYNDVHIKPRYDLEIDAALAKILPYFYEIKDKKVEERSQEEVIAMLKDLCREIGDDIYDVVAAVLGVDRSIEEYMDWFSVINVMTRLPYDFPEVFNEAEGFSE